MPPTTPRVDINKEIVDKAKQAMKYTKDKWLPMKDELKRFLLVHPSAAAESYKAKIVRLLDQAGFR